MGKAQKASVQDMDTFKADRKKPMVMLWHVTGQSDLLTLLRNVPSLPFRVN